MVEKLKEIARWVMLAVAIFFGSKAMQQIHYMEESLTRYAQLQDLQFGHEAQAKRLKIEIRTFRDLIDGNVEYYLSLALVSLAFGMMLSRGLNDANRSNKRL